MTDPLRSIARECTEKIQQMETKRLIERGGIVALPTQTISLVIEEACRSVLRAFVQQLKAKCQEDDSGNFNPVEGVVYGSEIDTLLAEWDAHPPREDVK